MPGTASDIRAGGAFVELYAEDKALQRGLAAAQRKLRAFAQGVTAISRTAFSTGLLGSFGLGEAGKTFAEFENQMLAVRGISQASRDDFQALWEEAKRLGSQTSFTAQQVAEAMTEMARGGFKAGQIISSMNAVLNLSKGTMTDLTLATQTTMRIMNQFGLGANEAARVVDVLAIAANNSTTTVEELAEAFVYAGPDMKRNNATMEDTAAMFAVLANAGVTASTAGVQLRRVMRNLADPAVRDKLHQMFGIDLEDAAGNFMGLPKVLSEIERATGELSSMDVTALFEEMFGRGSNAAAIIGANKEQFHQLLQSMREMRGEGGRLSDLMSRGLKGAFVKLSSAFEGFRLSIGEQMAPTLIKMFEALREGLAVATKWVENNKEFIVTTLKLVVGLTALGAAGLVVGAALKGFSFVIDMFAKGVKPIAKFTESLAGMAPVFYKVARSALHMADTLYHTLRGIVVQGYALGASWRYFIKYGVEGNPFFGGQMAAGIRRTGLALGYFKDMSQGAYNGVKAMLSITKASSMKYSGQTFTSQLGEGFQALKKQAATADKAIQKFFTNFANVASARSLGVLTQMANLLTPIIVKANQAAGAVSRFAQTVRQLGVAGSAQYALTGVQSFFTRLPSSIMAGTSALNRFSGQLIFAIRNWMQGTKKASIGGFFRGMQGLSRMLILDIIKADRQMAKFFGTIRRGVRMAVSAFKTLAMAVASALMATVVGIFVQAILEGLAALRDWVLGWKDLNAEVDEFLEKLGDKKLTGNASMVALDDAHMLLASLGDVTNRTREQTEDLWNSVAMLEREYGNLGIMVDEVTGRITNLDEVLAKLAAGRAAGKSFGALKADLEAIAKKREQLLKEMEWPEEDARRMGEGPSKEDQAEALKKLDDRYSELTKTMTEYIAAMHKAGMSEKEIADVVEGRARGPSLSELEEKIRIAEEREKMLEDKRKRAAEDRRAFDESIENRLFEARTRLAFKGHEQAMRLLDIKFREEMRSLMRIQGTKDQQAKLAEAQELERQAIVEELERNHQRQLLDHQDELARLQIERDYEGHLERLKMLEFEQQAAIRAAEERNAGNPKEMLEAELKLLEEIYNVRRDIIEAENREQILKDKAEMAKDFYERSIAYAEQLKREQQAAKDLADQLRGRSIGGVWGGNRIEQMVSTTRPIEKRQLDALEKLIEEEKKTREAVQDLNPLGATGVPGIL